MDEKVVYLDDRAFLKDNPFYRNLITISKKNPELVIEEINSILERAYGISQSEGVIFLMGYLSGLCAMRRMSFTACISELEERMDSHFKGGYFNYRRVIW